MKRYLVKRWKQRKEETNKVVAFYQITIQAQDQE